MSSNTPLDIPAAVLARYHAHYNNTTYRAFSDALATRLPHGAEHPDHNHIMNLLIDVSLARSGATLYAETDMALGHALQPYADMELYTLAEQHLRAFNPDADATVLTLGLLDALERLQKLADSACCAASEQHCYRGRMAYYWLAAMAALARTTYAILNGDDITYVHEKLRSAKRHLHNGIAEGATAGLLPSTSEGNLS